MAYRIPVPQGGAAHYGSAATARVGGQQHHQNHRYVTPPPNYGHPVNMSPQHHAPAPQQQQQQVYTAYSPQPAVREQRVPTLQNLHKLNANLKTNAPNVPIPHHRASIASATMCSVHNDACRSSVVSSRGQSASAARDTIAPTLKPQKPRVSDGSSVLKSVPELTFGTSNTLAPLGGPLEPTVHVYHSHSQELQALQSEIANFKGAMDQHRDFAQPRMMPSREEQLEEQLKDLQKQLDDKSTEMDRITIKLNEADEKIADHDKTLAEKEKILTNLSSGNETMRQKQSEFLDSVNEQVHTFESEFEGKNARIAELLNENHVLHADYDDAMEKLRKAEGHIERQLEEVETEKEHVLELMDEVLTLRTNSKTLHIAIDTLKNTHDKEKKNFEVQLEEFNRGQENKDINAINLNAEIADLRDQLAHQQRHHEDMLEHKNREQLWGEGKGSVDDEMVVKEKLHASREKKELEERIRALKKEIHVLHAVPQVPQVTFSAIREHQKDMALNQNRKDEMKILRLQQEVEMYKQQLSSAAPAR